MNCDKVCVCWTFSRGDSLGFFFKPNDALKQQQQQRGFQLVNESKCRRGRASERMMHTRQCFLMMMAAESVSAASDQLQEETSLYIKGSGGLSRVMSAAEMETLHRQGAASWRRDNQKEQRHSTHSFCNSAAAAVSR